LNLQKLSRLDLNLLVALQALLEEKSVTKAASRLFISQPAMSRVLQKLRYQLDDPLFTRTGNELIPTPKARELQHKLPSLLDNILDLVDDGKFDPGKYRGEIRIAVPEFVATSLISKLISLVTKEAPGLVLSVSGGSESVDRDLSEGQLDFTIDISRPFSDELMSMPLAVYIPCIWMRKKHPLSGFETLTLDQIIQFPFVQYFLLISKTVTASTDARFDKALRSLGMNRRKALVTNQLVTAIETVSTSDCLMVATQKDFLIERERYEIVTKPFPKKLPHDGSINLVLLQHQRTSGSAIHLWIAEKIIKIVKDLEGVENLVSTL